MTKSCRTRRRSQRDVLSSASGVAKLRPPASHVSVHLLTSVLCDFSKSFLHYSKGTTASANFSPPAVFKRSYAFKQPTARRRALAVAHASPSARARARSVSPRAHARPPRECHSALPLLRRPHPISTVRQRWVFRAGFYGSSAALMRICVAGVAHLCPALRVDRRCALTLASAPAQVPRPCAQCWS